MNLENQPKKKLFYIWLGFQSVMYYTILFAFGAIKK